MWEELQGTVLARGVGAGSPSHQPPAGQALLLLLHPSVTVMHFCEPAKAELLLNWGHWRCNSRSEDSPWQPYHGLDFPTSFNYS